MVLERPNKKNYAATNGLYSSYNKQYILCNQTFKYIGLLLMVCPVTFQVILFINGSPSQTLSMGFQQKVYNINSE